MTKKGNSVDNANESNTQIKPLFIINWSDDMGKGPLWRMDLRSQAASTSEAHVLMQSVHCSRLERWKLADVALGHNGLKAAILTLPRLFTCHLKHHQNLLWLNDTRGICSCLPARQPCRLILFWQPVWETRGFSPLFTAYAYAVFTIPVTILDSLLVCAFGPSHV